MPPRISGAIRRHHPQPPPLGRRTGLASGTSVLPGVELGRAGTTLVLRFGTPHPGQWSPAFRADVIRLLAQCRAGDQADTLVLTGARLFEGTGEPDMPDFADLLAALNGPGALAVAAIPGAATGTGLELALACHARIAHCGSILSLPGILAGRLPVNGGIDRLGRLLDPGAALEILAFGEAVPATVARRIGLVDLVTQGDVADEAAQQAACLAGIVRRAPARIDITALQVLLHRRVRGEAAPQAVLHALVQARAVPPQRALSETRELAVRLAASAQGIALRHAASTLAAPLPEGDAPARLRWALLREAMHLLDDGARPQEVDLALRRFGFHTAPLAAMDRDGLENVSHACVDARPDAWVRYSPTLDLLLDAGRLGRAAGAGWYRYAARDPRPLPDPALDQLLTDSARASQHRRRLVPEVEIVARCVAAMVGEAARLIEGGCHPHAADAMSLALGFPRWRGGIWYHAGQIGYGTISAQISRMLAEHGTVPPPAAPLRHAALAA